MVRYFLRIGYGLKDMMERRKRWGGIEYPGSVQDEIKVEHEHKMRLSGAIADLVLSSEVMSEGT